MRIPLLFALILALSPAVGATLVVEDGDSEFVRMVNAEVDAMREGKRGVVCRQLIRRIDTAEAKTTVRALGPDESTWHSNDRKGTRSYVAAVDTRVRGAERTQPTDAILYVHPSRVDPSISLFRLGTFVHELSFAADLNEGQFSGDFRIREKRASFYRNAWLDSMGLKPVLISDRVPTPEYSEAKKAGYIADEHSALFPILQVPANNQLQPGDPEASPVP